MKYFIDYKQIFFYIAGSKIFNTFLEGVFLND